MLSYDHSPIVDDVDRISYDYIEMCSSIYIYICSKIMDSILRMMPFDT